MKKQFVLLMLILIIGAFLRFYRLNDFLPWSADINRDIVTAREIINSGNLPLYGPPTSLKWLRLGPIVYYLWAIALYLGSSQPVSVAILVALCDLGAIIMLYFLARVMFKEKIALYASLLYAVSPFAVIHARTPLHANLVPFFSILFYFFLYKFISRKREKYFYLSCSVLGFLIQFHLTPVVLAAILFVYTYRKFKTIQILKGFAAFCLPLIPFFVADAQNNFFVTFRLSAWVPYRILSAFGFITTKNLLTVDRIVNIFDVTTNVLQNMIFIASKEIAVVVFAISLLILSKNRSAAGRLIQLILSVSYVFIFIQGQPAEHYFSFLLPVVILSVALLFKSYKIGKVFLILLVIGNVYSLLVNNYYY